jgi:hypothetical protein
MHAKNACALKVEAIQELLWPSCLSFAGWSLSIDVYLLPFALQYSTEGTCLDKTVPKKFQSHLKPSFSSRSSGGEAGDITFRAVFVGALIALFVGISSAYIKLMLGGTSPAHNFSTPISLFSFFVYVVLINVGLGLFSKRLILTRAELAIVYIMAMIAAALPTIGFTSYVLPIIAGVYYYATPENDWAHLIHPDLPRWMVLDDHQAVKFFYEGLPQGGSIPWGAWLEPLFYWCLFILALFWVSLCMMVILRKQWMDQEKLIYPLIQVPLEMIQDDAQGSRIKPFFKSGVMWLGFALPFLMGNINALHNYFPFVPGLITSMDLHLFRETTYLRLDLNVALLGFAYLINRDIALGFWLFFLVSTLQRGAFSILGIQSTENLSRFANSVGPYLAHQAMGAMIVLVLSGLWMGREHLREVFRKTLKGDPKVDDSDEILSYRTAAWGLLIGLGVMGVWLWKSGLPLWIVPIFLFAAFVVFIALTRAVAEGGISVIRTPLTPADFVISGLGTTALGTSGLIGVAFTYIWSANIRVFFMPILANALKLAEEIRDKKKVVWALVLAVLISMASSIWQLMDLAHTYGGINLYGFFFVSIPQSTVFTFITPKITDPVLADWGGWVFTGIGAALMGLLTYVRYRFVWWPIHPIGFATGTFYIMNWVWFSVFLAWSFKTIILKYGGSSMYGKSRPFFLGLIIGQIVVAGQWWIIDFFTGKFGNSVGYF